MLSSWSSRKTKFTLPCSGGGGRVAGFGRDVVVCANGVVWSFTGDAVLESGRFVTVPETDDDGTATDGNVVAGNTLGIKIHSAGVSVLSSEIENETRKSGKQKIFN